MERRLRRAVTIARRAIALRCPRCGGSELFPRGEPSRPRPAAGWRPARRAGGWFGNWFRMERACRLCGLYYERAQGYWVGAIYINYAVSAAIAVGGYFALRSIADLSTATQFAIWVPFLLVFPLWFFRWSRSLWLAVEFFVNPEH